MVMNIFVEIVREKEVHHRPGNNRACHKSTTAAEPRSNQKQGIEQKNQFSGRETQEKIYDETSAYVFRCAENKDCMADRLH